MLTLTQSWPRTADRSTERRVARTPVQARRLDHSILAHRQPRLHLRLDDVSINGLSAISDEPVVSGEQVGVYFPAEGGQGGWGAHGRVVRCEPSEAGYQIAVEFEPLRAA